jgi:hypothetical protein
MLAFGFSAQVVRDPAVFNEEGRFTLIAAVILPFWLAAFTSLIWRGNRAEAAFIGGVATLVGIGALVAAGVSGLRGGSFAALLAFALGLASITYGGLSIVRSD